MRKAIQVPYEKVSDEETTSVWENQRKGAEEEDEGRAFPVLGKTHILVNRELQERIERFNSERLQAGYQRRKDEQKQMKSGKKLHLVSTDPDEKSISFRVYDRTLFLSLNEWSVRLGLYTPQEAITGAWGDRDLGLPRVNSAFRAQEAWRSLTHEKAGKFKPSQSKGVHFADHTLRFAQVYLSHNLFGQSNSVSTITTVDLYLTWCMQNAVKVHLGFWIAYAVGQIASHPTRHLTACHLLGAFVRRNFLTIMAEDTPAFTMVPPLALFDLKFFANTHLIKPGGSVPQLYEVGASDGHTEKREEAEETEHVADLMNDLQKLVQAFTEVAEQQKAALLRHEEQISKVIQMMQKVVKHCNPNRQVNAQDEEGRGPATSSDKRN